MRYTVKHLISAIPTVLFAGILSVDFAGTIDTLYLSIFGIYAAIFIIGLVIFLGFAAKTKDIRHPMTLSAMILLIGMILLPILESPVLYVIKHNTSFNRVSAFISSTYQERDFFDFTITAHGVGSEDKFSLERGYTNISINKNYYEGPSLYYRLRPNLEISIKDEYKPLNVTSLKHAFEENQLSQLAETTHITSFNNTLETLSTVDSKSAFAHQFQDISSAELDLVPYENAVYRVAFGIIAFVALLLSAALYRRQQEVEQGSAHQSTTRSE